MCDFQYATVGLVVKLAKRASKNRCRLVTTVRLFLHNFQLLTGATIYQEEERTNGIWFHKKRLKGI